MNEESAISLTKNRDRCRFLKIKTERSLIKSPMTSEYTEQVSQPRRPHKKVSADNIITLEKCSSLAIPQLNPNISQIDKDRFILSTFSESDSDDQDEKEEHRKDVTVKCSQERRKKPIFLKKSKG